MIILERKTVSVKPNEERKYEDLKPMEHSIDDVLKNMRMEQPINDLNPSKTEELITPAPPPLNLSNNISNISKKGLILNAADYLRGASVDNAHSSRSNLNPIIGYDQTNLVLLDRPQPPTHKAWCSNEHNPVLTINLAKYIKPISVSYQHSKWTHDIPMSTPRTYDVVACLDFYCQNWKPLVSNCEYSSQSIGAEQFCNISFHLNVPLIGKVQFRFKENYGDSKMTCVHLVRVYGETDTPVQVQTTKNLGSEETCADLKYYYYNSYFKYTFAKKNCSVLYENDCCSDCPECCEECTISDYNWENCLLIVVWTILADYLRGASVDNAHSSRSNLNPIIGYDQTNLVLLDRPQPPTHKAWCSNEHNPVLTINLAKYIKPISVSYQHSKWTHHIPMSTPRTYDVVACFDSKCKSWVPLVSNCEYRGQSNGAEQFCNISSRLTLPLIERVQFLFRENYGDPNNTCVHLVRVYGETEKPVEIEEKSPESAQLCKDLTWYYHNSSL
ncbi:hypothetical protein B9Z55_000323 [Caenorhabditis nigoni]|uniref:SUN domain-containing protein n=1 Tax=Caenorhabditis nigoni TaxID=1611254 RepID=A0A2G5VPH5_9PELO|nr:hypothetical protein B9Z55_000323 [Caenorhabditis nigoni]